MYAVPLTDQQIAIARLLRGDTIAPFQPGLCFASCTAPASLYLVTAQIYRSERLAISA